VVSPTSLVERIVFDPAILHSCFPGGRPTQHVLMCMTRLLFSKWGFEV